MFKDVLNDSLLSIHLPCLTVLSDCLFMLTVRFAIDFMVPLLDHPTAKSMIAIFMHPASPTQLFVPWPTSSDHAII